MSPAGLRQNAFVRPTGSASGKRSRRGEPRQMIRDGLGDPADRNQRDWIGGPFARGEGGDACLATNALA